ncbi:MAG: aldo/keto reductase [FCB group bacterium]|jgi:aryl-alcohol dehydrogenase-like predicted oxidoreductase|nr:aldo/keto reductase [FCB group bacterium]
MKKVALAGAGLSVSELCLGTMHMGTNTPDDVSVQILDAFAEGGGTFLDTANIYNRDAPGGKGGESERLIGRWMKERGNRDAVFVASKAGLPYPEQEGGLRAAQIEQECDRSLERLGVDVIDLYYAHIDDRNTPLEETLAAFDRLVKAGKVRCIGASNYRPTRLVEALWASKANGWTAYCCVQNRYSYLRPRIGANFGHQVAANEDLLDFCREHAFPLIGFAPFLKGAVASTRDKPLRGEYVGPESEARSARLRDIAKGLGLTEPQLILAWMRHHEMPIVPLIGASSVAQLIESLRAVEVDVPAETMERLT